MDEFVLHILVQAVLLVLEVLHDLFGGNGV